MSEPFLGQIQAFGFNFAPRGWATCSGQILSIAQNTALFSLLGTTYGGNGQTTFALPDLRGRVSMSQGQGPGLSNYTLGEVSGTESTVLTPGNLPAHNHAVSILANSGDATFGKPSGKFLAQTAAATYATSQDGTALGAQATGLAGSNQPFPLLQPFLVINWCIALEGIFPSRN